MKLFTTKKTLFFTVILLLASLVQLTECSLTYEMNESDDGWSIGCSKIEDSCFVSRYL